MSWSHSKLRSTGGTHISLDFVKARFPLSPGRPDFVNMATAGWVNVSNPGLQPGDTVHMVLRNESTFERPGGPVEVTEHVVERKLHYAEPGRFTTTLPDLSLYGEQEGGVVRTRQKVSIDVNGVKESDPLQAPGADFNVDMWQA